MFVKLMLESKFTEVAFSMHAEAARDKTKALEYPF